MLDTLFTPDVLERLKRQPSEETRDRVIVLTATDPDGVDEPTRHWNRYLRARREAWNSYVTCTSDYGLLDEDLRVRLTGVDENNFRSGLAECMTCWFVTQVLGLPPLHRPAGRPGRMLDLGIGLPDGDIRVEVKSPFAKPPDIDGAFWGTDYSKRLDTSLIKKADEQFEQGCRNILFIVPFVQPVVFDRAEFVATYIGERGIAFTVDRATGMMVGEPEPQIRTSGKLLRIQRPKPLFTRVGAVVSLREKLYEHLVGDEIVLEVQPMWFVIHNPNTPHPIPTDIWHDCPQLVVEGEAMYWTDGRPIFE